LKLLRMRLKLRKEKFLLKRNQPRILIQELFDLIAFLITFIIIKDLIYGVSFPVNDKQK